MNKAILKKNFSLYKLADGPDSTLDMLAYFLIEECMISSSFFINWLKADYDEGFTGGDWYVINKEKDMISIDSGSTIALDCSPYRFFITTNQMIEILMQWSKIIDQRTRPNTIIITEEEGKISITACD